MTEPSGSVTSALKTSAMDSNLIRRIWQFIAPHRSAFLLLVALSAAGGLMMSVGDPLTLKYLIEALEDGNLTAFIAFALLILLLATAVHGFNYLSTIVAKRVQNAIHSDVAVRLSVAYYGQPYKQVLHAGEGYHVSRLHEEPREISKSVVALTSLLTRSLQLVAALSVAIYLSWQVTLTLLFIVPVLAYLSRRYGKRIASTEQRRCEEEARFKSTLGRIIRSYQSVRLFRLLPLVSERVRTALASPLRVGLENVRLGGRYGALSSTFFSYAELAVIIVAGLQVLTGNLSIGGLFGFMRAYQIVMQQVNGLANLVPTFARLDAAVRRHDEYLQLGTGKMAMSSDSVPDSEALVLARGIQLGYGDQPILESLDLSLMPGESLLIRGRNGTGKSTLALFLAGLLEPDAGQWKHPGMDAVSASFVGMDFFPGTVEDCFSGLRGLEDSRLKLTYLLDHLGLLEHLQSDPNQLSQGQKAKLRIALALIKPAQIYVLDEPLSNIDTDSKAIAARLIREMTRDKTLVVISHEETELIGSFDGEINIGKKVFESGPGQILESRPPVGVA